MNWRKAMLAALLVIPLLVVLALGFGRDPHRVPSVLEGHEAPAFVLSTIEGTTFSLTEQRGHAVVINFWSTWCEPCKYEHELLQQAARRLRDQVQFVGVVYQDTEDSVREYLHTKTNGYPQVLDVDSKVAIDYGVAGVPESFIIDPQGIIRLKHPGVLTAAILRDALGPYVQGHTP